MRTTGIINVGILGGGQLGRMLIESGLRYPIAFHVLDPDPQAPCAGLSRFTCASFLDADVVFEWGKTLDVVTIEIEHVNGEGLQRLADAGVKVHPRPDLIAQIQDKGLQKDLYRRLDIPTASYQLIQNVDEIHQHRDRFPLVQKSRKNGYDGRGVYMLRTDTDIVGALHGPSVLETAIDIAAELAVIGARNAQGETALFPPCQQFFDPQAHLLSRLECPAQLPGGVLTQANTITQKLLTQLDIVGLLAVEFFIDCNGKLWVNEMAPRPHNSGHHTIEACATSQYDQHLRAILGWPLGPTDLRSPCVMFNVLGDASGTGPATLTGLEEVLKTPSAHLHLYGKSVSKPLRKMGHLTVEGSTLDLARKTAEHLAEIVRVGGYSFKEIQ